MTAVPINRPQRPTPLSSLIASARRLTGQTMTRQSGPSKQWQDDAWEMFDLVGEQRFLATTLANRMAQARLYVGQLTEDMTAEPEPVDDGKMSTLLDALGPSAAARAQMIQRLGVNLFVAGDSWLAGIPKALFPASLLPPTSFTDPTEGLPTDTEAEPGFLDIEDLEWRALSVTEVQASVHGQDVTIQLGQGEGEKVTCDPEAIFMVRIWRPHPRRWWEADSPTRSSLPVLRELVGLTMHISAQVDSRLAGAGLLIVPQSARRAINIAAGLAEDDETDLFTEALLEAMMVPIQDRASASAIVPLTVTVPDEVTDKFNLISFSQPLDAEARSLRDEAIRRLALGQDAPPELLLGTGGMNHWGAWLVREDVVTTHIEPPLALICDALTTQYLWPVLMDQGMAEEKAQEYVVWYDVSHMIMRPNRADDAKELHARGVLSDATLRDATGFDESDEPEMAREDGVLLTMVTGNPGLLYKPGVTALRAQLQAIINGTPVAKLSLAAPAEGEETGDASPQEATGDDEAQAAAEPPPSPEPPVRVEGGPPPATSSAPAPATAGEAGAGAP